MKAKLVCQTACFFGYGQYWDETDLDPAVGNLCILGSKLDFLQVFGVSVKVNILFIYILKKKRGKNLVFWEKRKYSIFSKLFCILWKSVSKKIDLLLMRETFYRILEAFVRCVLVTRSYPLSILVLYLKSFFRITGKHDLFLYPIVVQSHLKEQELWFLQVSVGGWV